jgi:hypothetical protein
MISIYVYIGYLHVLVVLKCLHYIVCRNQKLTTNKYFNKLTTKQQLQKKKKHRDEESDCTIQFK